MTKDEALKLALEALKTIDEAMPFPVAKLAQAAIKEALAQPECARCKDLEEQAYDLLGQLKVANLKWSVAHPWVELSDSQIENIYYEVVAEHRGAPMPWGQVVFAKAVQAMLKELNT